MIIDMFSKLVLNERTALCVGIKKGKVTLPLI